MNPVKDAMKASFTSTVASAKYCPAEIFCSLFHLAPPANEMQCSVECCNEFAKLFAEKINCIHNELDSDSTTPTIMRADPMAAANPISRDSFQLIHPEDVGLMSETYWQQ